MTTYVIAASAGEKYKGRAEGFQKKTLPQS